MSAASKFNFGPITDLVFDLRVGRYLGHSPTIEELDCLRKFISDLQSHPVPAGKSVGRDTHHFHVCNHIVEIKVTSPGCGVVTKIYRDITSDLVASLG
jgi:hypothetical protein